MVFGSIRRRADWKAAIVDDARRLIDTFNEQAYFEARETVRGTGRLLVYACMFIGPGKTAKTGG